MAKTENHETEIIDNAIRLIYENGFKQTTLRKIAECSGVSHPAIYNYFSSKSEICVAIMDRIVEGMGRIAEQFLADTHEEKDPDTIFSFYWLAYYRLIEKDERFKNMVREFGTYLTSGSPTEFNSKYSRSMYRDLFGYDYKRTAPEYFIDNLIVSNAQAGIEEGVSSGFLTPVEATIRLADVSKAVMKIDIRLTKRKLAAFDSAIDWDHYLHFDVLEDMLLIEQG